MTITKGRVKYTAGAPREGQYGPSINILVVFAKVKERRWFIRNADKVFLLVSNGIAFPKVYLRN